jgi:hypothetical protein
MTAFRPMKLFAPAPPLLYWNPVPRCFCRVISPALFLTMRLKTLILSMMVAAGAAQDAGAQAAAPRDVREVFLALPFPAAREG